MTPQENTPKRRFEVHMPIDELRWRLGLEDNHYLLRADLLHHTGMVEFTVLAEGGDPDDGADTGPAGNGMRGRLLRHNRSDLTMTTGDGEPQWQ